MALISQTCIFMCFFFFFTSHLIMKNKEDIAGNNPIILLYFVVLLYDLGTGYSTFSLRFYRTVLKCLLNNFLLGIMLS